jgi:hypothetical protein
MAEQKSFVDEVNEASRMERQTQALEHIGKTLAAMHGTLVKIEANTKPKPTLGGMKSSYRP